MTGEICPEMQAGQPGDPCARLDATLGHQGFTNLGTLDSVREGKFERSPDGLKILESCWARENDECGSAQSGDDLSRRGLSVLRMLRMRGAEGNKVFPGFACDNVPAFLFQLGTTWRGVSSSLTNGGILFLVGTLHM